MIWLLERYDIRSASDKEVNSFIKSLWSWYIWHYVWSGYQIRYAFIENSNKKAQNLIFIHGSPWSMMTWESLLKTTNLYKDYNITLVDRPWFGQSTRGQFFNSQQQWEIINSLIRDKMSYYDNIIVWHSQAWQLLPYLGSNKSVNWIVMVAWATDPDHQIIRRTSYMVKIPLLKYIMPSTFWLTAQEWIESRSDLTKALDERKNVTVTTIIVQGKEDFLVPYQNAEFAIKMMTHNQHELMEFEKLGHLIPFNSPEIIVHAIKKIITMKNNPNKISGVP